MRNTPSFHPSSTPTDHGRQENIRVGVRIRPMSSTEAAHSRQRDIPSAITAKGPRTLELTRETQPPVQFRFDSVLRERASQLQAYDVLARPVVSALLAGYNASILAYGESGSGKTYTIHGPDESGEGLCIEPSPDQEREAEGEREGFSFRALRQIFSYVRDLETGVNVTLSCVEVYKEKLTDLFNRKGDKDLVVRHDKERGIFVQHVSEIEIGNLSEAISLMKDAIRLRHTGTSDNNNRSSRSHAVLTIK
ncbi:kinesin-like protein, partial [Kipferlia bialata]|eukprot:g9636.t1